MLGLHCCTGSSLVVASKGYSLVAMHSLLIVVVSLVVEHGLQELWLEGSEVAASGLQSTGLVGVVHRLGCSMVYGNLPGSDIKPMSPALVDGLFTTEPPGKPKTGLDLMKSVSENLYIYLKTQFNTEL